ncbi:unnamed protein product [Symbiodinium sp. CCMP2592]|nr:unnamed protein product [Symbiodinium sp. CCMP2592]
MSEETPTETEGAYEGIRSMWRKLDDTTVYERMAIDWRNGLSTLKLSDNVFEFDKGYKTIESELVPKVVSREPTNPSVGTWRNASSGGGAMKRKTKTLKEGRAKKVQSHLRPRQLLGVLIPMDNQPDRTLQDQRVIAAQTEIHPIVKLPVPLEEKATLLSLKTSGGRYGLELEEPSTSVAHDFDQNMLQALCGQRALRCKYTCMGLAWRGHRLFLEMAVPYQAFDMARRQLLRLPMARELLREVWEFRDTHSLWDEAGVCCHLRRQCQKLQWTWEEPFTVQTRHGALDLCSPVKGWFQHGLRMAIRQSLFSLVPARKDLQGIQAGVDYVATTALLRGSTLDATQRSRLRFLWEGRVATEERSAKHRGGDPTCPHCTLGVPETSLHVSKECPQFADCRKELLAKTSQAERDSWAPCFWNAGILPVEPSLVALHSRLPPYTLADPVPADYDNDESVEEWFRGGRLVVAGDGACANQGTLLARAGFGAFFGPAHPLNFACALEGPVQDSDRAELRALLRVARWTPCLTEYLCDNEAVVVGFEKLLCGSAQPWADHVDLWSALRQVLDERGVDLLQVSFVKGHADELDIATGRATLKEACWNTEADRLAVQGAALHDVPAAAKDLFRRREFVTKLMQRTLLAVHEARTLAWTQRQLLADPQGPVCDSAPAAEPCGASSAAAQTLPEGEPRRQLQTQDVFAQPQLALPRYCWDRPAGGARCSLPPLPQRIGAAPSACDRHKGHPDHLPWRYGSGFIEPLYWFWASLEWVDQVAVGDETVAATSFCELAIAFQLLTGLVPDMDTAATRTTLQQRAHFFTVASKRLSGILGARLCPGDHVALPDVLRRLRFQTAPGVAGRFSLPADFWRHYCAVWVRAHLEVPITSGAQRQLKWQPNFDRPPEPLWRSSAPIGFETARRWRRDRDIAVSLASASSSARAADGQAGLVQVCQPSPVPPERRVRGKQPGVVGVVAPAAPVPKARAVARQPKLAVSDLSVAEAAQLEGLTGVRRNQVLKLLCHNRDAVARGKHYIVVGHEADTVGQLKCRDCSMLGRWAEWPYYAIRSNCKRWCYQGKVLAGNRMLADYGIEHLSCLEVMPVLKGGGVIGKEARNKLLKILEMTGRFDLAHAGIDELIHRVDPATLKTLAGSKTTKVQDILNVANKCDPPVAFSSTYRRNDQKPPKSARGGQNKNGVAVDSSLAKGKGKGSHGHPLAAGRRPGSGGDASTPVTLDAAGLGNLHVLATLKRNSGPCLTGIYLAESKAAEEIVRELRADPWPAPLAVLVLGNLKANAAHWLDTQLLASGAEVAVPTCQGTRRMVRKMVAFQVGSEPLTIPSPAVFDLEEEFESYQTWNMQVRQTWAPTEIWQACCEPQPSKPSATGRKVTTAAYLSELLKTLLLAKLKLKEAAEVEAWSGRKHGDSESQGGCIDSLIRIPQQYEEAIRRASGQDGIFFERKFASDIAKESERSLRPLIAVPGDDWNLDKILTTLRETEGAEGFEVWGKRLMLRVQGAHEAAARLKLTGKEQAPTDLLWRMTGVPHLKVGQLSDFLQARLLWEIEEVISFRKKEAVIRAATPPPADYLIGGQDAWSIIMGSEVVTIRQIIPKHRRQEKGPVADISFAKASRPAPKDWSKLLTPVPHAAATNMDLDGYDPDLDDETTQFDAEMAGAQSAPASTAAGALDVFLRSQAKPGSAKHSALAQVATELTAQAQTQLRQAIDKNAEDAAAQQQWIENAVDSKLASFQKALTDQQAIWEQVQDRKLQDLQTSQKEFQAQTRQEFQNVHDTAATRHHDLMGQMSSMMAMLQAHGPSGEKRSSDFPESAAAKAKVSPGDSGAKVFFEMLPFVGSKIFSSIEANGGIRDFGIFSATWRWLARHAGLLLFLGLVVFSYAILATQPVNWQVSFLGIRLGEADLPGHRRRAAKGYGLARAVHNIRLRSHNMGGLRHWDKKSLLWSDNAADVIAVQETWADAKDVLDGQKHFAAHGLRSFWSPPGPARGQGSGTMVAALRPVVSKEFFTDGFDSEMDHLWTSTRVAGAWVETSRVDHGFAVLSFYGIAGANACNNKRAESERLLLALLSHLGAYRHRPIFLCMDANLEFDKSDTMRALVKLGWTDLAAGLGGTFKTNPANANPNSRIDFVFANPAAAGLVLDVRLQWLPGFQHAALDIDLHLGMNTGPITRLRAPKRMPQLPQLAQPDLDTYEEWAHDTWQSTFAASFDVALDRKDTTSAWQVCEAFDAECLQMRLEFAGVADPKATVGRGGVPKVLQSQPAGRREFGYDHAWTSFVAWLRSLLQLQAVNSVTSDIQLETRWRLGCDKFRYFLSGLLALDCSLPAGTTWWQELQLRLDRALHERATAAALRNQLAKTAWCKKMRSIVHACKHLKGPQDKQTTHLVDKATGEITVVVSRMHDMLLKAWQPLFSMYATKPEPDWHDFANEYAAELQDWRASCPDALPSGALAHAVRTRGSTKVGGTDGWTTAEGHLLPEVSFCARQACLDTVAHGADWPPPLLFGTVPMLPKNDSGLPEDQRPLTCLSLWNVCWDKAIFGLTKSWLHSLLPVEMRGARAGGTTMDVAWVVALLLEHAHCYSEEKAGYLLDREKCFDRLPWAITFALEQHTGFPSKWSQADCRLNRQLQTAFRLGPLIGPFWSATNSFRQGLSSSVRRVSLVMGVWVRRQLNILPRAFVGNYYDDCLVVARSKAEQQCSMDANDRFDTLTGQKVGHKKTVGFTVPCSTPTLCSRGQLLRQVSVDKLLGVLIPMDNQPDRTLQDQRVIAAQTEIHPIVKLPVPLEEKATLLSLKTSGARYGLELEEPSSSVAHDFDQNLLQALCGQRALRCKYTSMGLAWRGHRLFLEMAVPYQAFDMARRQLLRLPMARELLREVWEFRDTHSLWDEAGVCCHLRRQCQKLQWTWEEPFTVQTRHGALDLCSPVKGWFQHGLRMAIRQSLFSLVPARKDLQGIQAGVDYVVTTALLRGSTLDATQRSRLRFLWEGRVATEERSAKHRGGDPTCPHCTLGVPETSLHVSKECPQFADCRKELLAKTSQAERDSWAPCFWNAGILPVEPSLVALHSRLPPCTLADPVPADYDNDESVEEWFRGGRLVVAGDGACANQGTLLARAGFGAFFGPAHPLNFACALEGPVQDSDRAELRALLRVARWTPCLTEYLCDNEAVVVGFEKLLCGSAQPWADHVDLWSALRQVLDERGVDLLQVSFVKGHADELDIATGRATLKEACWNTEADRLAVQGAALHDVPAAAKDLFRRREFVTKLMQRTLLAVHEARTLAWTQRQLLADPQGPVCDSAPAAEPCGASSAAAQTLPEGEPRRQLQTQDVFAQPQLALPRYCWDRPAGGARCSLPPLPQRIGAAPSACDRHKGHPDHLPWRYGSGFIEPLYWFWASLEWVDQVAVGDETVAATSFCELAIAFQLLTGLVPDMDTAATRTTLQQRAHFFTVASKRLSGILGARLCPGDHVALPDVLRRLRFQTAPGVAGRFSLPADFWRHYCAVWVRAHLEVPITSGAQRQLKWQPNFDRPPEPLWRSSAPIGFETARRWRRDRDIAVSLASASSSACAADGQAGLVQVCQPSPVPPERRVRGKQPGVVGVVAPAAPVPKARAVARQPKLAVSDLSVAEAAQLEGLTGVRRNQVLKLLCHNRDAVARGKHYIVVGHEADTVGQLKCRDCSMLGRWAEWPYYAIRSNCKRQLGGTASSSSASRAR